VPLGVALHTAREQGVYFGMAYYFYVWKPEIIEHLAEHGVTPDEFEEVVSNNHAINAPTAGRR
jgi:hypothetical protein